MNIDSYEVTTNLDIPPVESSTCSVVGAHRLSVFTTLDGVRPRPLDDNSWVERELEAAAQLLGVENTGLTDGKSYLMREGEDDGHRWVLVWDADTGRLIAQMET